ncbi:MAG: CoA-acylating methylmalonate-semialdehyde dehydrogenase, partial [Chloroflexota bacterium]|nr:CoA-acylating methylmalonate-semialdehyde dehydrogenase [Chloroflexota bacterium]
MATASESRVLQNLVKGAWVDSRSAESLVVPNPATGGTLARVPLSTAAEVREAVAAASASWPAWRDTPVIDRAHILFRMRALLEEHFEALAASVTAENGKTLAEARGEVRRGVEVVEFACGMPSLMQGSSLADVSRGIDTTMLRMPLGVVAGITPFNFPAMIPLWMAPIALATGNCFVHKPSERTPLTSNMLADLWMQAGLPAGVFSVTHGAKDVVNALLSDPEIAAVSFVGSQPVAAYVYETAAAHSKRVQALAGAKNFVIVMPDANMSQAADIVLSSAFGNAGERCLASSVVVTVGDAAETLTPLLVERARAMRVGDGADSATEMGPVIRSEHRARVASAIERGLGEGARLALDGRDDAAADAGDVAPGYFLRPSIFTEVGPEMSLAREEIFGPVLSVMAAPTLDAAITTANRSRFGNAAVICTTSGAAGREFQMRIEAGMVGV